MNEKLPRLSTDWPEAEPFRIARLNRVVGFLTIIHPECLPRLAELHDHKGALTATWRLPPRPVDEAAILLAWQSPIGDPGSVVSHRIEPMEDCF